MKEEEFIFLPLSVLQDNKNKLGDLSSEYPEYSNYVIQNISFIGNKDYILGQIVKHYPEKFAKSQTCLRDHLELKGVEKTDKLGFSFEQGTKILALLKNSPNHKLVCVII